MSTSPADDGQLLYPTGAGDAQLPEPPNVVDGNFIAARPKSTSPADDGRLPNSTDAADAQLPDPANVVGVTFLDLHRKGRDFRAGLLTELRKGHNLAIQRQSLVHISPAEAAEEWESNLRIFLELSDAYDRLSGLRSMQDALMRLSHVRYMTEIYRLGGLVKQLPGGDPQHLPGHKSFTDRDVAQLRIDRELALKDLDVANDQYAKIVFGSSYRATEGDDDDLPDLIAVGDDGEPVNMPSAEPDVKADAGNDLEASMSELRLHDAHTDAPAGA
ncbi:hypothetical protein AURDEDRAFT_171141 [Auricularia subglabra TFB-10046 SS5]|uniref:Uncharacterized protein n=1 Tax=Auricularia subglabra (strain TFB-10046 / SS5) TaxID=717982 RepID=J0WXI4_AURST|nr:hypothetical protein AURDEDRAFT_171141 [Auricularia subglabra TFB-10046 SS5]